jgi:hypothetical protein
VLRDGPSIHHEAAGSDVIEPRKRSAGTLYYVRHFVLLGCLAVVLAATSPWRPSPGAVASFGLYGALHSSTLVVSLRTPQSFRRKLLFIAIATCLSMLSVILSLYGSRYIGMLPNMVGPFLLLALSSGLGAASYAVLIREFWIADLSRRALISITLGCVSVALMVLTAAILLKAVGGLWFAVCWWFAFSAGLWYREAR